MTERTVNLIAKRATCEGLRCGRPAGLVVEVVPALTGCPARRRCVDCAGDCAAALAAGLIDHGLLTYCVTIRALEG